MVVKCAKKSTKKPVKKSTKKPVKKSTKKPVKKSTKKPAKKSTKKPAKKSTKKPAKKSIKLDITPPTNLANLLNQVVHNSKGKRKTQSNLASKIIDMSSSRDISSDSSRNKSIKSISSSHSKSVQSTYSSLTTNGKTHEYGQTIKNDSDKPYINVTKLNNGKINVYQIPRI